MAKERSFEASSEQAGPFPSAYNVDVHEGQWAVEVRGSGDVDYKTVFASGVQSFTIAHAPADGGEESRETCEWFATQFRTAMRNLGAPPERRGPGEAPFCPCDGCKSARERNRESAAKTSTGGESHMPVETPAVTDSSVTKGDGLGDGPVAGAHRLDKVASADAAESPHYSSHNACEHVWDEVKATRRVYCLRCGVTHPNQIPATPTPRKVYRKCPGCDAYCDCPRDAEGLSSGVARKESPAFDKMVDAVGPVDVSVLAQAVPYDSAPWGESRANDRWNLKGVSGALIDVGDVNVDDADYSKSIYELARQRDEVRARSERAEMRKAIQPVPSKTSQDDLAAWRELAGVLRNHESHIQGILADVDWGSPDSMSQALEDIGDIINRICPEGAKPNLSLAAETEIETPPIQPSLHRERNQIPQEPCKAERPDKTDCGERNRPRGEAEQPGVSEVEGGVDASEAPPSAPNACKVEPLRSSFSAARAAYTLYQGEMHRACPEEYPANFEPWDQLDPSEMRAWTIAVGGTVPATPSSGPAARIPGWSSPSSLTKDEVLENICRTLDTVWKHFDPEGHESNDCFCAKATYHRADPRYFRSSGQAVVWVQDLVREALATLKGGSDHG